MKQEIVTFLINNVFSLISVVILIQSIFAIYQRRKKQIKPKEMWRLPILLSIIGLLEFIQIGDYSLPVLVQHVGVIGLGFAVGYIRIHWSKLKFTTHPDSGAVYFHNNIMGVLSLGLLIAIKMTLRQVVPPTTGISSTLVANYLLSFSCGNMVGRRIYLLKQYLQLSK